MSDTEITIKKSEFEAALREVITEYAANLKTHESAELEAAKAEIDVLKIDIAAKDGELEGMGNYIHEKMTEIERLKAKLARVYVPIC